MRQIHLSPVPELDDHWSGLLNELAGAKMRHLCNSEHFELPKLDDVLDILWADGALEAVSPADQLKRSILRRNSTGLPWETRGNVKLYWRIFSAAQAELCMKLPEELSEIQIRPLGVIAGFAVDVLGSLVPAWRILDEARILDGDGLGRRILHDFAARAAHEVARLTDGPEPERFMAGQLVFCRGAHAKFVTCTTNGQVVIDRETPPPGDPEWMHDVRDGRHSLAAWPWELTRS